MAFSKEEVPALWQESHVLAETGWTWEQLNATPADVVNRLLLYKQVRHVTEHGGNMRFDDAEAD